MAGGYAGRLLFVDLSRGEVKDEQLEERLCREFIGGYGIGARVVYSRQVGGVDALGPENTLGFITGPLTGTVPFGARYSLVGKSPLTGTWGDSNAGGDFGAYLKLAGYDGVFVTGAAPEPVYLLIKEGRAELRDATPLWGKDTKETEGHLRAQFGQKTGVAAIGPSGERLSLISCVISSKGRAAGRSGLGAVMGSKKLKAVAALGRAHTPVAYPNELVNVKREHLARFKGPGVDSLKKYGWSATTVPAAYGGGSPVKNWGGVASRDFPYAERIGGDEVIRRDEKRYFCHGCPVGCGALMKAGTEYDYKVGAKRPEYETIAAFGTLCLNDNLDSILKANDICNRYGLDTISTGATIAFAIECYENGIIGKEDTQGLELTWGNHRAIVAMTEKIAKGEGLGAVLADGVKMASERIGKGSDEYAIHIHGQEPPMWDPKFLPSLACTYQADPTPGRHTRGGLGWVEGGTIPPGLELPPVDKYVYTGKGKLEAMLSNRNNIVHASGICNNPMYFLPYNALNEFISIVTGWQLSPAEVAMTAERIAAIRQAFNLREGLRPQDFRLPGRMIGDPPLSEGPAANITVDVDALVRDYYLAMDWSPETGKPSKKKLRELGLEDVSADLTALETPSRLEKETR